MTVRLSDNELASLSLTDLKTLRIRVTKAIENYEVERLQRARAELDQKARELGFSLDEIVSAKGVRRRTVGVPKYANPADRTQTWSGRGRKPGWFNDALAAGHTKDSMRI